MCFRLSMFLWWNVCIYVCMSLCVHLFISMHEISLVGANRFQMKLLFVSRIQGSYILQTASEFQRCQIQVFLFYSLASKMRHPETKTIIWWSKLAFENRFLYSYQVPVLETSRISCVCLWDKFYVFEMNVWISARTWVKQKSSRSERRVISTGTAKIAKFWTSIRHLKN